MFIWSAVAVIVFPAIWSVVAFTTLPVTLPFSRLPVTLPIISASNVPFVIESIVEASWLLVVVPIMNLSVLSSQPIKALSRSPLSIIIPESLILLPVVPWFNSIILSFITVLVVSIVVVAPFTVKLLVTVIDPTKLVVVSVMVKVLESVFSIVAPLSKFVVPSNIPSMIIGCVNVLLVNVFMVADK